jgi:2-keto-3-deoxy-L-arabinonate dehydratase
MSAAGDQTAATGLRGVIPVLYAFHGANGGIDAAAMTKQVEHCLAAGAHGVMVLGLITEVGKHSTDERLEIVRIASTALGNRKPLLVTNGEPTQAGQRAFALAAREAGADVIILQPPPELEGGEEALLRFFGGTADALDFPCAIQHNPINLKVNLSLEGLIALCRNHPNIQLIKAEGTALETQRLIAATAGKIAAFTGHGGIEFMTNLRSGAAGLIPAPDALALQALMHRLFLEGTPESLDRAERIHRDILPTIVFMMRSFDHALCYGKRLLAERMGVDIVHERQPILAPTAFGIAELRRFATHLAAIEKREGLSA